MIQMETCDVVNEDFSLFIKPKTTHGARTDSEMKMVPKFRINNTPEPGPRGLKKRAVRSSTSFHRHPKRSQPKISAKKITKTEVTRPSLSHKKSNPHQKVLTVPNSQLRSHCDIEKKPSKAMITMKQHQGRVPSKKSLLQNHALLLCNANPHDSNLRCCEENTSIRYSRRMPAFPPVSSSHANAQPVTSDQWRISLVGEGGEKKARFTGPTARQSVEGKCLLVPPKLSVVSLKLPKL